MQAKKTKREQAFSQGSCGKMKGEKTKREKPEAFSQGSCGKMQGGKNTKKRAIRAIRAIRTIRIRRRDLNGSCLRVRERKR